MTNSWAISWNPDLNGEITENVEVKGRKNKMHITLDNFDVFFLTGGVGTAGRQIMAFQHPRGGKAKYQAPERRTDIE